MDASMISTASKTGNTIEDGSESSRASVQRVITNYKMAKLYHQRNLDNSIENWRFYYAKNPELGYGQYKLEIAQKLMQQGRQLLQYNFIKPTVDALAGALLQLKFDPLFIPVNATMTSLSKALQKAMYSDKELLDWNNNFLDLIVGGLIHEGCIKFVVSDEYSALGNIGFETCLPGSVFPDPSWKSAKSKDCKRVHQEVYLTAEEMMAKFPAEADKIQFYALRDQAVGARYGTNMGVTPYYGAGATWGSKYRIIQEYTVVESIEKTAYIITVDGAQSIPKMPEEEIGQWLDAYHPGWSVDYIFEENVKNKKCVVKSVCETLLPGTFLEDGATEVQIGGTPFKFWSASRFNGDPLGIVDAVKDAQTNINYWESMIVHKLQTEGGGGAQFSDSSLFKDTQEYQRFRANRNNPREVFDLKPGYIERGVVPSIPVVKSGVPTEIYQHLTHIIDGVWPHISKVTPATLGRTEGGNPSGILQSQLQRQADVMNYTLTAGLRNCFNDIYEGYLEQAAQTYSNELLPRKFDTNGGKESIILNERVILEDGSEAIKNDASKLKEIRHKVIISERPESPSEQMANVAVYSDMIQSFAPLPSAQALVTLFTNEMIANLPQLDQEAKEKAKAIGDMQLELAYYGLQTQVNQAKAAVIQTGGTPEMTQPAPTQGEPQNIPLAEPQAPGAQNV